MKLSRKLVLGLGASVLALGLAGAVFVQADRGGARAKVGVTTVLQNGCSHMGADTQTNLVAPAVFPGTVVNSRQVYMLCNSAVYGWFNTETREVAPQVPVIFSGGAGTLGAGDNLGVAMRATCVAPAVSAGCTVGDVFWGGPGVGNAGFNLMSFLKFNATDYETHSYNHLWPNLLKGHWLFEVIVANQAASVNGAVEFRAFSVQTGFIPSAQ